MCRSTPDHLDDFVRQRSGLGRVSFCGMLQSKRMQSEKVTVKL